MRNINVVSCVLLCCDAVIDNNDAFAVAGTSSAHC